jgi:hypothetical protein
MLEKEPITGLTLNAALFQTYSEVSMAQAAVFKPGQYRHLIRVTEATSHKPRPREMCLFYF